MTIRGLYIFK